MRASHDYDQLVNLAEDVFYGFKVPMVEWLEPANIEAGRQLSGPGRDPKGLRSNLVAINWYALSREKVSLDLATVIGKRSSN